MAVRSALSKRTKRRDVLDGTVACWAMTNGRVHTAADDQSRGWRALPMVEDADAGCWSPDPTAPAPCFDPTSYGPVVTFEVRQRLQTTKSLTWPVACSLTRLAQFLTRRHVKPQQFELRTV